MPNVNSTAARFMAKGTANDCRESQPNEDKYSPTLMEKPIGSTAFVNPEKINTRPNNNRQVSASIFIHISLCLICDDFCLSIIPHIRV